MKWKCASLQFQQEITHPTKMPISSTSYDTPTGTNQLFREVPQPLHRSHRGEYRETHRVAGREVPSPCDPHLVSRCSDAEDEIRREVAPGDLPGARTAVAISQTLHRRNGLETRRYYKKKLTKAFRASDRYNCPIFIFSTILYIATERERRVPRGPGIERP